MFACDKSSRRATRWVCNKRELTSIKKEARKRIRAYEKRNLRALVCEDERGEARSCKYHSATGRDIV